MSDEAEAHAIAEGWIRFHRLPEESVEREEFLWAYDELSDLVRDAPRQAWRIIQVICHMESSDAILSNLAAGPMEDILVTHGEIVIDDVVALANSDQKFKKVLGAVWKRDMPGEIWKRIRAVASPSW